MFDYDLRGYWQVIRDHASHCSDLQEKINYFSCAAHKKQTDKQNKQSNKQKWYSLVLTAD